MSTNLINLNNDFGFDWTELSYKNFDISNSFSAIRKLNSNQEKSLSESKFELEETIKSIKDHNKDEGQEFIESYIHHITYDDEIMIDEIQRLQRYSLVMSIFAFYEAQLKSLCNIIEEEFKFSIKMSDLNNSNGDLKKYWTYLSKVFKLETEKLEELFEPLNIQKKIRNIIVHQDGLANEKYVKGFPNINGLSFRKSGESYILQIEENVYIEYLLKQIEIFFKSLLKEADKRYKFLKTS